MTDFLKTPRTVHKLDMASQVKLALFVQERYSKCNATDEEFAATACAELGFHVTKGNVQGVRQAFAIESNLDRLARERAEQKAADGKAASATVLARLEKLESQFAALSAQMRELCDKLGGV